MVAAASDEAGKVYVLRWFGWEQDLQRIAYPPVSCRGCGTGACGLLDARRYLFWSIVGCSSTAYTAVVLAALENPRDAEPQQPRQFYER